MKNLYKELDKYKYQNVDILKNEIDNYFSFCFLSKDTINKLASLFLSKYKNKIDNTIYDKYYQYKVYDF
jgi:hypothetical protein